MCDACSAGCENNRIIQTLHFSFCLLAPPTLLYCSLRVCRNAPQPGKQRLFFILNFWRDSSYRFKFSIFFYQKNLSFLHLLFDCNLHSFLFFSNPFFLTLSSAASLCFSKPQSSFICFPMLLKIANLSKFDPRRVNIFLAAFFFSFFLCHFTSNIHQLSFIILYY